MSSRTQKRSPGLYYTKRLVFKLVEALLKKQLLLGHKLVKAKGHQTESQTLSRKAGIRKYLTQVLVDHSYPLFLLLRPI